MSSQPPKQGFLRNLTSTAAQYIKDVVTLKVAKDNFFRDDGTFDQWLAHGANEAANVVVHGQTATIYGGSSSPPFQSPDANALSVEPITEPLSAVDMQIAPAIAPSHDDSILGGLVAQAEQTAQMQPPEMEYEQ
ncbi:hypothetical protein FF011L_01630 [Roseimaritima multifibrata]|uniref:Uncharacterized protein n=1 Tax=Roseimaritima multifibrata TaxID=1930274 RepID=A0A517M969_9BACT|nr:hypothetical protein [Roseimaritima multifibrata]QDS91433.1 hypothetical protein FF011L_01630 [Roseimaritima multifibrata]